MDALVRTQEVYPESIFDLIARIGGFLSIVGILSIFLRIYNSSRLVKKQGYSNIYARMEKIENTLEEMKNLIDDSQIKSLEQELLVKSSEETTEKRKPRSLSLCGHCIFEESYASEFDQPSN